MAGGGFRGRIHGPRTREGFRAKIQAQESEVRTLRTGEDSHAKHQVAMQAKSKSDIPGMHFGVIDQLVRDWAECAINAS